MFVFVADASLLRLNFLGTRGGGVYAAPAVSGLGPEKQDLIGGAIRFGAPPDPVLPVLDFNVAGTVGPAVPSGRAAFAVIGLGAPPDPVLPSGIIAILIGLASPPDPVQPSAIEGTYRLYDSFLALYTDVFHGTDSSFSHGSFVLPAVQ